MDSLSLKARKLSYFVSKKAFDITEIGPKNIEFFLEKKIISEPADIFKLKVSDIENFFGFGKKSAENIVEAIKKKKKISLERFLISLGIDEVGEETSHILAKEFLDLGKIMIVNKKEIENIDGIGEVMAKKIISFFKNKKNNKEIKNLLKFVEVKKFKSKIIKINYFTDKKILITGSFDNFSRDELKEIMKNKGGKNVSSISKNTDILLAGNNAGSKLEKAKSLGVEILDEKKILKILEK
jgi:DNA ligase (NAD+)